MVETLILLHLASMLYSVRLSAICSLQFPPLSATKFLTLASTTWTLGVIWVLIEGLPTRWGN